MKIVIPFSIVGSHWQNNELRYLLRSLDVYLNDISVIIIGDAIPDWTVNVEFVKFERRYPEAARAHFGDNHQYENFYDTLNKLKYCADNDLGDFLWTYDDVILLREPKDDELQQVVATYKLSEDYKVKIQKVRDRWQRTIARSLELYPCDYHYEHHMPLPYHSDLLKDMFKEYDPYTHFLPYAPHTLYFNMYYKPEFTLDGDNDYGAMMYNDFSRDVSSCSSDNIESIRESLKDKLWLNYADRAINQRGTNKPSPLKEYLEERFPNKSKYES